MPKNRAQKKVIMDELSLKFGKMKSAVFTSIAGYTMADADSLRAKGRKEGVEFMVAKKTLLVRSLKDAGVNIDAGQFEGSILTAVGFQDEIAPAKLMAAFLKGRDSMKIVAGVLEGKVVDASSVKTLAKLPSKQELLAKLVGTINAPLSGLVQVLAGTPRGFVRVLQSVADAKGKTA